MPIAAVSVAIGMSPFALALCCLVIFRSYSSMRRRQTMARWAEDILIWLSLLGGITNYGWQVWNAARLSKYHGSNNPDLIPEIGLPPGEATAYMKGAFVSDLSYVFNLWTVKGAFLAIQYDMTRAIPGWHRALIYVASVYLFLTFCFCFFMSFVYCRADLSTLWSYTDNYCSALNLDSMITTEWVMNFTGDMLLIVLYILIIRRLMITGRQLFAFAFIFFLIGMTMTASTVAFANLIVINNMPDGSDADDSNFEIWGIWTFAEWAVALFAVCLPALRAYFREKVAFTQNRREIAAGRRPSSLGTGSGMISRISNSSLFKWVKGTGSKQNTWQSSHSAGSEGFRRVQSPAVSTRDVELADLDAFEWPITDGAALYETTASIGGRGFKTSAETP